MHVGRLEPSDWLGRRVHAVIDRPLGSVHPEHELRYELNYGFVPGQSSPDGDPLDAYILGPAEPIDRYDGEVIAVVLRRDDVEDKLVVGDAGAWTADEIAAAIHFQERYFDSLVVTSSP